MLSLPDSKLKIVEKAIQASQRMADNNYPFMGNFMMLEPIDSLYDFSCMMPITKDTLNPYRIVYGGVTAMLADMAMAWMLDDMIEKRDKIVTLSMNVNYHSPGRGKTLIAHCKLVQRAQNIMQASCEIVNDRNELIVTATGSFLHLVRPIKGKKP
ncbi:hypothetical protein BEP19_16635 [Ammoniphilus oxalaticus]|uniref:Thioesterase domain-containing protein n=2 Tax=Ammoniphilus oxalaticus TaxID=66863 RepID=A0A419SQX7_9BACL|nr:hypothetical protein BEP19_16635 [Ammoniphilus oxalaticus]